MNQIKPSPNRLCRFTRLGLGALLFTPLIVTSQPHFASPIGKATFFRIGVEILFVFYTALVFQDRRFLPPRSPLLWSVVAYLALFLVATVVSLDRSRSWWGTPDRMEGAFAILHYGAFFIMLAGILRTQKDWVVFFNISVAVSVLIAVYALEERITQGWPGVTSTMDAPPFLAAYTLIHVFLAALIIHWATTAKEHGARTRITLGWGVAALGLNLLTLFLAGERGAIVGLGASLLALSVAVLIFRVGRPPVRWTAKGLIVLLILAPFILHYARGTKILRRSYALERLAQVSLNDKNTITRLINLGVSWRAFKARPVFGYGPELFFVAYNRNFNPEQLSHEQGWVDRAHNKLADVLVMQGLVGLVSYLGIFVAAGWLLYGALKRKGTDTSSLLVTFGLLVAYFVQNLFLFDTPASHMMFYAVLAWVTFLAQETPAPSPTLPSAHPRRNELRPRLTAKQQALLALLSIVMVVSIFNFNVKAFTQFRSGQEASSSIGDPQRFFDKVGAVLSYRSWLTNDVVGALADVLTENGKARDAAYSQPAEQVAAELEKQIADKDLDPRTYIRLGALYNLMADVNRSSLPKAETVLEALIQLAPKWPESYDALGETYLLEGRNDEALAFFRKAVEINPDNGVALWMYAFPLIWTHHEQEGRAELEAAIRHYDYHNPDDLKRLVNAFYQFKDLPKAIQFEEELVQFEPADAAHRYTLAILYKSSGNRLKALEEMQIAAQLDPRYGAAIGDFQRESPP
jgi:O-antigen ligase/tetratricopeptide (TPR) repeat protein